MNPLRQFAPTLVSQCRRQASSKLLNFAHARALSSGHVSRQSSHYPEREWAAMESTPRFDSNTAAAWQTIRKAASQNTSVHQKGSPDERWEQLETSRVKGLLRPHNAYSGRSVAVYRGDVGSALSTLKNILNANGVRYSHVRDERHEKKGEKRNRLRSLRWRRRFAHEVRKKVQLVNEIRARGA
ncbi:hypothetical protein C8Q80DRAFT_1270472 [Daedaleopsis nitida]|nr:hypothetical protein C8Q80DRAFT_1270472 [Daedaleopsis nitida]